MPVAEMSPALARTPVAPPSIRRDSRSSDRVIAPRPDFAAIPTVNPKMAIHGDCARIAGISSMATAANTTPAAACCSALVSFRRGGHRVAATAPPMAAATGMRVKSIARTMAFMVQVCPVRMIAMPALERVTSPDSLRHIFSSTAPGHRWIGRARKHSAPFCPSQREYDRRDKPSRSRPSRATSAPRRERHTRAAVAVRARTLGARL